MEKVSNIGGTLHLIRYILRNKLLEDCDRNIVKKVLDKFEIKYDNLTAINFKIAEQTELENSIIYLYYKYSDTLVDVTDELDNLKGSLLINMPTALPDGDKLVKVTKDKSTAFVNTDKELRPLKVKYGKLKNFVEALDNIKRAIFYRDKKLETISTNYRKELSTDE